MKKESKNPNPASSWRFFSPRFTAEQQEGRCSPQEHPAGFAVGCLFKRVHLEVVVICIGFLWLYVGPEGKDLGVISLSPGGCWHFSPSLETTWTDTKSNVKGDQGGVVERGFRPSTFPWDKVTDLALV